MSYVMNWFLWTTLLLYSGKSFTEQYPYAEVNMYGDDTCKLSGTPIGTPREKLLVSRLKWDSKKDLNFKGLTYCLITTRKYWVELGFLNIIRHLLIRFCKLSG